MRNTAISNICRLDSLRELSMSTLDPSMYFSMISYFRETALVKVATKINKKNGMGDERLEEMVFTIQ